AFRERAGASLVIIFDLVETVATGVLHQRLDRDRSARHVVKNRLEPIMKKRQPMFHAGMTATLAHRLVQEVVGRRRAKGLNITKTKALDGLGGKLNLGDRHEADPVELVGRALAFRIEATDGFERIAEEIEPHRSGNSRRI